MPSSSFYLATARGLTLLRLASIPLFLLLLVQTDREGPGLWGTSLLLLYVFIALSDLLDGPLARKAGAPDHFWGQVDAAVDIVFNSLSLSAAAWLGRVGPWVPAAAALLGGRFIIRNLRHQPALKGRLDEDWAGKAAGVVYYLLVGAVALELSLEGEAGRWLIARAGDAVFLYTLFVLLRRARPLACPVPGEQVAVGLGQKEHTKSPVPQHEGQVGRQAVGKQVSLGRVAAKEENPCRLGGTEMGHGDRERAHEEDHGEECE